MVPTRIICEVTIVLLVVDVTAQEIVIVPVLLTPRWKLESRPASTASAKGKPWKLLKQSATEERVSASRAAQWPKFLVSEGAGNHVLGVLVLTDEWDGAIFIPDSVTLMRL